MITVNQMVLILVAQGFIILLAVLIGGLLVFKTKREAYDPFFQFREEPGESFNISEEGKILETEKKPELPPVIKRMNERFMKQTTGGEE